MYKDFDAVRQLAHDVRGYTIHRRGLMGLGGRFVDLHVRVPTELTETKMFTPEYCQELGRELSGLDAKLFQDYVLALFDTVSDGGIVGAGGVVEDGQVFFAIPSIDLALFAVLRSTLFSVVTGNYMSKLYSL